MCLSGLSSWNREGVHRQNSGLSHTVPYSIIVCVCVRASVNPVPGGSCLTSARYFCHKEGRDEDNNGNVVWYDDKCDNFFLAATRTLWTLTSVCYHLPHSLKYMYCIIQEPTYLSYGAWYRYYDDALSIQLNCRYWYTPYGQTVVRYHMLHTVCIWGDFCALRPVPRLRHLISWHHHLRDKLLDHSDHPPSPLWFLIIKLKMFTYIKILTAIVLLDYHLN